MKKVVFSTWAGVDLPKLNQNFNFDISVNSFKKLYKGKKEMDVKEILQNSIANGCVQLRPFERILVGTGLQIEEIENEYRLEIVSKPGFVLTKGVTLLSSPTYIHSDYKKEIVLILYNSCQFLAKINIGDVVAQGSFVSYKFTNISNIDTIS